MKRARFWAPLFDRLDSADKMHLGFKDSASFEYDRSSHVLDLKFQDNAEFKYDAGAHLLDMKLEDGAEN
jgi:phage baseplate assembly protein gpV